MSMKIVIYNFFKLVPPYFIDSCPDFSAEFGGDQPPGLQHVIKAGDLKGRGTMGKVVEGIALPSTGFAVFFADPKTAVLFGVIKPITGRLQQSLAEHRMLLAAFQSHNYAAAEKIMHDHLINQRTALLEYDARNDSETGIG